MSPPPPPLQESSSPALRAAAPTRVRAGAAHYVQLARLDHWFKNVLMLPGTAAAAFMLEVPLAEFAGALALGVASICLVASANYVLNEWLDAAFDRFHPVKRHRPSVVAMLDPRLVWTEYALLCIGGIWLGARVSPAVAAIAALLWIQGFAYNVRPFRTKDRVFVDVLSESLNNPIRLAAGWYVVSSQVMPPWSLLLGYWMFGAFLMAMKRYAEIRFIGSSETAGRYRRSFLFYTEERLLVSAMLYAFASALFLAVFVVLYRIELLLAVPFLAVGFAWYLHIGMKPASAAQTPEHLYRERGFVLYIGLVALLMILAFLVDVPALQAILDRGPLGR